jgi:iron complex outermembrane recepter protein
MLFLSTALLSTLAGASFAQTTPATTEAAPQGELIVTATKRETKLQNTAISISVVGSEQLKNSQVSSLLDIGATVPSLRMTTFESRQTALTVGIRGIVPGDANQPAREQGVGVYLDGVYLGKQQGLNSSMLDIQRIEVLRGPQGTLFGRNTEGGALSLVTRKPTGVFGIRATAGVSNFNGYNADIHLDLPETYGVSVKIDYATQYHDATTKNPLAGQLGWNFLDKSGARFSALWKPTDKFDALYSYDRSLSQSTPLISQLVSYNTIGAPISSATARPAGTIAPLAPGISAQSKRLKTAQIGVVQEASIDKNFGHSIHMNYKLTDNIDLRSITAYREVAVQQYDNAGGPARPPVFQSGANFSRYSLSDLEQLQRSQEFQLVGNAFDKRLDYVVGLYYFNEKAWEEAASPSSMTYVAATGAAIVRNPITAGITRGFRSLDRGSTAKSESKGLFVHTVFTPPVLNDALHITLGGRFTKDEKNGTLYKVSNVNSNFKFSLKEDRFDPVVTLAYDVNPDLNVYGTYSTGYRAGGANSRSLTFKPFESEEVTSYELGLKGKFFAAPILRLSSHW